MRYWGLIIIVSLLSGCYPVSLSTQDPMIQKYRAKIYFDQASEPGLEWAVYHAEHLELAKR
ncbi:MAG: hypothetical protein KIT27_03455 [Legionellales bacterium]|nr:hypothetical protein [Legionellales bacterium]